MYFTLPDVHVRQHNGLRRSIRPILTAMTDEALLPLMSIGGMSILTIVFPRLRLWRGVERLVANLQHPKQLRGGVSRRVAAVGCLNVMRDLTTGSRRLENSLPPLARRCQRR